ncbi:hypothetical protein [Kitasatospora sp. NPDC085464]|uniref:hypothetical protein n=1 Tax=Kitasatospora sp. NPDC085464 TaxID=3364063 RepID=UPI0037CC1661
MTQRKATPEPAPPYRSSQSSTSTLLGLLVDSRIQLSPVPEEPSPLVTDCDRQCGLAQPRQRPALAERAELYGAT